MTDDHGHADDTHGHESHDTPAAHASAATAAKCRSDDWFKGVQDYATGKIATFVAFLFLLITLGAVYAVIVTGATLSGFTTVLILAPAIVGLIAYANRDIAVVLFVILVGAILLI